MTFLKIISIMCYLAGGLSFATYNIHHSCQHWAGKVLAYPVLVAAWPIFPVGRVAIWSMDPDLASKPITFRSCD